MVTKIISGGQTGADRATLDVGLELGFSCGGWYPKGRRAEDGPIPPHYLLQETDSTDYRVRTEKNVVDSRGTLVLTLGPVTGGTAYTVKLTKKHKKPYFIVDLALQSDPKPALAWLLQNEIQTLNVAGPRESKVPGIHDLASIFLRELLRGAITNERESL
jgi:hypothetical protein